MPLNFTLPANRVPAAPQLSLCRRRWRRMLLALAILAAVPASRASANSSSASSEPTPKSVPEATTTAGSVAFANHSVQAFTAYAGTIAVGGTSAADAVLASREGQLQPAAATIASNGPPIARMSYTAYLTPGDGSRHRPLVFLYDGGPGIPSRSLLMAGFGPVRIHLPGPGQTVPFPPAIENNPDSLLDVADLVVVDAPGTGFGQIGGQGAAGAFYGINGDAAAFKRFIERFVLRFDRLDSPVYLLGHSYGTMRSAVLAHLLAEDDRAPRGVIAISQWLDDADAPESGPANPGIDEPYIDALPTYAAIAAYHHRISPPAGPLADWLSTVEAFALHEYATALLAGSNLSPEQRQTIANRLESFTGIPAKTWIAVDLRLDGEDFKRLVLGEPGRIVGHLDGRYTGVRSSALDAVEFGPDPYSDAIDPLVAAASEHYQRDVLHIPSETVFTAYADLPYQGWNSYHSTTGHPWQSFPNVMPDLTQFMLASPSSRILVMNGIYDLNTTYLSMLQELRHLRIPGELRNNIAVELYPAGHEPYVPDDVRHAMHDRIARFLQGADRAS